MKKKEMHVLLDYNAEYEELHHHFIMSNYCDLYSVMCDDRIPIVYTTLTCFLSFAEAERLFVHVDDKIHEITLGECEGTNRCIKEGHNIEKLLLAREFDWF